MTMLYITGGAVVVALAAGYIAYQQRKRISRLKGDIGEAREQIESLNKAVRKRNHAIRRMEEVNAKANKDKRKIRDGDSRDQFDSSLDVLRDNGDETG